MKPNQFASWSRNNTEACYKFCRAAEGHGFKIKFHKLPDDVKGPDGEALHVVEAYRGPSLKDLKKVAMVTSGAHGAPEGLPGAEIQITSLRAGLWDKLPEGMGVTYVYGLNAHGMAHGRRNDENNVDFCRSFIDGSAMLPEPHPLSASLRELMLSEKGPPGYRALVRFIYEHGLKDAQTALTGGQRHDPKMPYFGGNEGLTANGVIWKNIVNSYSISNPDIAHVDLHTGLGRRGRGQLMVSGSQETTAYKIASSWWNDVTSIADGTSSSSELSGDMDTVLYNNRNFRTVVSAALEFGTVRFGHINPLPVVIAMAHDNWVYAHGIQGHERQKVARKMQAAFNPASFGWRRQVINRSMQVFTQMRDGLAAFSPDR